MLAASNMSRITLSKSSFSFGVSSHLVRGSLSFTSSSASIFLYLVSYALGKGVFQMLLTRQQILRVVLNRTPPARNGSDSAIAIVIKIFIRRESAGKIDGMPIRTKTRHLLSSLHTWPGEHELRRQTKTLLVVRRGVPEGVIDPPAMPFRSIHKPVEIFFDIDGLQDQAFIPNGLGVFDQNSRGTVDAPHAESCPQKSAVRIKFFQVCHRVETIDRDSVLSGKAVIGLVTDSSSIEQLLPFHAKLKSF